MSSRFPEPVPRDEALRRLAAKGNPFRQQFARNSDDHVCALYHVAGIFERERAIVRDFVDGYRGHPERPTAVLPVLGARGAGKTHLLHNLKHAPGEPPHLFVTPGTFRIDAGGGDSIFLEYVLHQFINVLLAGAEQRGVRPLIYVGEPLTRHRLAAVARQAAAAGPRRWLGRGPDHHGLAEALASSPRPCKTLVAEFHGDVERLVELVAADLAATESRDLKGQYRQKIILGFVRAALLGADQELADFLTDGFADVKFLAKPTRTQMALSLLQALTELIVGAGIPAAVAFDQLEELLYGNTEDEIRRASDAFFGGVVQLMSQVPGLSVLLLVEEGLWNRIVPPLPSHILDRIHEPIHLPEHGTLRTVRLPTPTLEQLVDVVWCRVQRTLADFPGAAELPAEFPFARGDLQELAQHETVLRLMLQGCCNRLDEMFAELAPAAAPRGPGLHPALPAPPPVPPHDPLDPEALWRDLCERWDQEVRTAERKLKPVGSLSGATADLHGGLCRWLQLCRELGVEQDQWRMTGVRDVLQVGDHPAYGTLAVIEWTGPDGAATRVGAGLWLGRGVGKPRDLDAKLGVFARSPCPIDHLILFRPADDARLTGRSQTSWEAATAAGHSVRLETVGLDVFAKIAAFPRWYQQVQEAFPDGAIPESVYVFLAEQTEQIMQRLGLPSDAAVTA